jgi:hypothetical protein
LARSAGPYPSRARHLLPCLRGRASPIVVSTVQVLRNLQLVPPPPFLKSRGEVQRLPREEQKARHRQGPASTSRTIHQDALPRNSREGYSSVPTTRRTYRQIGSARQYGSIARSANPTLSSRKDAGAGASQWARRRAPAELPSNVRSPEGPLEMPPRRRPDACRTVGRVYS